VKGKFSVFSLGDSIIPNGPKVKGAVIRLVRLALGSGDSVETFPAGEGTRIFSPIYLSSLAYYLT
jgi:hypothetical protein